jgi:hypothetical protein
MERSGGPPIAAFRPPGQASGASRRFCLILVVCWAVPGVVFWSHEAFVPPSPDGWVGWFYSVPSWVSLVAELAIAALVLLWVTLPVLLLAAGFDYIRHGESHRWRWRGAWLGAVGAGVALEALTFPLAYPFLPPTPDWGAFAESLGFVATGAVMTFVPFGAARSKAADRSEPGELPGSAVAAPR